MKKSLVLLVAIALCAAILVAASFLVATKTRGSARAPVSITSHSAR